MNVPSTTKRPCGPTSFPFLPSAYSPKKGKVSFRHKDIPFSLPICRRHTSPQLTRSAGADMQIRSSSSLDPSLSRWPLRAVSSRETPRCWAGLSGACRRLESREGRSEEGSVNVMLFAVVQVVSILPLWGDGQGLWTGIKSFRAAGRLRNAVGDKEVVC